MLMTPPNIETVLNIAERTRRDFEIGAITVPHLVEIALINRPNLTDEQLKYLRVGAEGGVGNFPDEACQVATDELKHRLGFGKIIDGSYLVSEPGGHEEFSRHEFLDISDPDSAERTIVDITADQFGGPPVYVGEWRRPWSTLEDLSNDKKLAGAEDLATMTLKPVTARPAREPGESQDDYETRIRFMR
jgi:hypothetical protein